MRAEHRVPREHGVLLSGRCETVLQRLEDPAGDSGDGSGTRCHRGLSKATCRTPVFNLTAGATVDEGNNWINISWGPLSLITPTSETNPSSRDGDQRLLAGSWFAGYQLHHLGLHR